MCTWLGRWDVGGCLWRQEYLVMFEDPFDSTDNTARTLGTRVGVAGWVHECHLALQGKQTVYIV